MAILKTCLEKKIPLVVATTGLDAGQQLAVREAAKSIPLLWSPSMSLAVNVAMKLAEIAGRALRIIPAGADVEIIERHHRFKEDAPEWHRAEVRADYWRGDGDFNKRGMGAKGGPGSGRTMRLRYHAVRTGDNPGEHTIVFGLLGETLELSVRATNRDCYAHGALAAAKFLAGKPAGLYSMSDVLGSKIMAKCEEGYLCDVCGGDVEAITESDLYLALRDRGSRS